MSFVAFPKSFLDLLLWIALFYRELDWTTRGLLLQSLQATNLLARETCLRFALTIMSSSSWNCTMCTFENGALDLKCVMCETPAPAAAAGVPVESAVGNPTPNASSAPAVVRITAEPSAEPQWFQSWDKGRRMFFYFNRATNQSVWEPPQGLPFVPHVGPTPGKVTTVAAPEGSRASNGLPPAMRNTSRFVSAAEPVSEPVTTEPAVAPVVDVEPVTVAHTPAPAPAPASTPAAAPVLQPGAGMQLLRSSLAEQAQSSDITQNLRPESK